MGETNTPSISIVKTTKTTVEVAVDSIQEQSIINTDLTLCATITTSVINTHNSALDNVSSISPNRSLVCVIKAEIDDNHDESEGDIEGDLYSNLW